MPYLVRHYPTDRDVTVPDIAAVHSLLTGWFADSTVDDLDAVDELCLSIEAGQAGSWLQVRLQVEIDRLDPRENRQR